MLIDTGPILAMVDESDEHHDRCREALLGLRLPLTTTLPVLTEAMHLLGRRLGWRGQEALWSLIDRQDLVIHPVDLLTLTRCAELMERYRNLPMDFADASLVAVAESLRSPVIFTLDRHFTVYRTRSGRSIKTVP